ncbi:hypothetical protein CDD82_4530 [Ophiocordyceps australis]|uniref:Ribosomal RNA-processing protein 7 C-terminal domain-containing protein n=1 Tax=Ophiocordyceps australis TaxID=1399860 RepID=A0A2C5Z614_9HYPO|nr:hypothetical protein CDD82_4530 [Ophiocordyceps australis]
MASTDLASEQFDILPIRMPSISSFPHAAIHEVRVRRNTPKIPTPIDSRSLFLKNVPVDSTEEHFRAIFAALVGVGRFESIIFDTDNPEPLFTADPLEAIKVSGFVRKRKRSDQELEKKASQEEATRLPQIWTRKLHRSSGTAIVVLADEKSVQLVLKAMAKVRRTGKYPVWGHNVSGDVPDLGSTWVMSHLRLCRADKDTTQRAVHAFFNLFNEKEKEAAELAKSLRNEPDEDGFVTVTRGGRAAPASRHDAEEARRRMLEKQAERKSETKNFYRFQLREMRKREQIALQKRFEQDRRKVDAMREKRGRFKPET